MIEKPGGFWITSSIMKPGESCSLKITPQQPVVEASDSDSELEELLRNIPEPGTPLVQSPAPEPLLTPEAARREHCMRQQKIWKLVLINYKL